MAAAVGAVFCGSVNDGIVRASALSYTHTHTSLYNTFIGNIDPDGGLDYEVVLNGILVYDYQNITLYVYYTLVHL